MLLLGFNRLDREPDECAVDALRGVKDQVLDWSAYWYWEEGDGSIISRPELEYRNRARRSYTPNLCMGINHPQE